MLKCKGTTLYPPAIFAALQKIPAVTEFYVEARSSAPLCDEVCVHVAVSDSACTAAQVAGKLQASLRVKATVMIEPEPDICRRVHQPGLRKPVRFFDLRQAS